MKTMTVDLIARASNAKSAVDKVTVALELADTFDEFINILEQSYGYSVDELLEIKISVEDSPVPMGPGFVQDINRIRDKKNGFEGLMFCIKHFGFDAAQDAMSKLFPFNFSDYKSIFSTLRSFRDGPESKQKRTRKAIEPIEIKPVLYERVYKPFTIDEKPMVAVYCIENGKQVFQKALNSSLDEVGISSRELDNANFEKVWPILHRNIYGRLIKKIKREHEIHIRKERGASKVQFYT